MYVSINPMELFLNWGETYNKFVIKTTLSTTIWLIMEQSIK